MGYISRLDWRDLTDRHLYRPGDPFPWDGREIPEERIRELESGTNAAGLVLIQAEVTEDAPEEKPVKPKAKTTRAKAAKAAPKE